MEVGVFQINAGGPLVRTHSLKNGARRFHIEVINLKVIIQTTEVNNGMPTTRFPRKQEIGRNRILNPGKSENWFDGWFG